MTEQPSVKQIRVLGKGEKDEWIFYPSGWEVRAPPGAYVHVQLVFQDEGGSIVPIEDVFRCGPLVISTSPPRGPPVELSAPVHAKLPGQDMPMNEYAEYVLTMALVIPPQLEETKANVLPFSFRFTLGTLAYCELVIRDPEEKTPLISTPSHSTAPTGTNIESVADHELETAMDALTVSENRDTIAGM